MPKFLVTFERSVIETHQIEVEAMDVAEVERRYDEGDLDTKVITSRITSEDYPEITKRDE